MKRKPRNKYSEDDLLNAISEVKYMPRINIKFLGISTLCDKIKLRDRYLPLTAKAGKFKFYKRDI